MKNLTMAAILIGSVSAFNASAQTTELLTAKVKETTIPAEIVVSVNENFPGMNVEEFKTIPIEILDRELVVTPNSSQPANISEDAYVIDMIGKDRKVTAMYKANGDLISFKDVSENAALPIQIDQKIVKDFPGWTATKDREIIKVNQNGNEKVTYKVEITKGNMKKHLVFDKDYNLERTHNI